MNTAEYLIFIPLLFYGMALADLLSQWRRFFDKEYMYWPYFISTLILTETAIYNVYIYLDVVGEFDDINYYQYWLYLIQPMLFLLIVHALTPEQDNKSTETYFNKRIPLVFGLTAIFVSWHLIFGLSDMGSLKYSRLIGVILCILIALTRKIFLIYVLGLLWFLSLFFR